MLVVDEIVLILAVDEKVSFLLCAIADEEGEVEQAARAVGLFAEVVVLLLECAKVFLGEGNGLCAGEGFCAALEEVGEAFAVDLAVRVREEFAKVGELKEGGHGDEGMGGGLAERVWVRYEQRMTGSDGLNRASNHR